MGDKPTRVIVGSGHPIITFAFRMSYRFFTGLPMKGEQFKNDGTVFLDAQRGARGHMTWWKKKSRIKRAGWRHAFYWPTLIVIWALIFYFWYTIWALAALLPYLLYRLHRAMRYVFFKPIRANGEIHWMLHPRIKRFMRRKYRPGLHSPHNGNYEEPPIEVQKAIHAQVEMDEQDRGRPFASPILRMLMRRQ